MPDRNRLPFRKAARRVLTILGIQRIDYPLVAFAVATLLNFMAIAIIAPASVGPSDKNPNASAEQTSEQDLPWWDSTGLLWLETRRLAGGAETAAKRQESDTKTLERAYLSVEPAGFRQIRRNEIKGLASINIRNAGRLPARSVSWFIEQKIVPGWGFKGHHIGAVNGAGKNVVPPGTIMRQDGRPFLVRNIPKGEKGIHLYVWGVVTYNDGFQDGRKTYFCHRYHCLNFEAGHIAPEFGRYHDSGNDSE